jgi:hypothetical protein
MLAAHGVFERDGSGFRHTPTSPAAVQRPSDVDARLPPMQGLPAFSATFAQLGHSIRTGSPAIETVEPTHPRRRSRLRRKRPAVPGQQREDYA